MSFDRYLKTIKGDSRRAIKVEWLNPDETVSFEFTNALYDMSVSLNVNYQNGSRRTCTLTINNDRNKFPINFNNIWIGQKFKLWMGIYIDEKTPYYFPQGVFYVSNPSETYNPNTRTITINGVDKWAYLDGSLYGKLSGIYKTSIGTNLYDAIRGLLKINIFDTDVPAIKINDSNMNNYFSVKNGELGFVYNSSEHAYKANNNYMGTYTITLSPHKSGKISFRFLYKKACSITIDGKTIFKNTEQKDSLQTFNYEGNLSVDSSITFSHSDPGAWIYDLAYSIVFSNQTLDPVAPKLSPYFETKKDSAGNNVIKCPYTATVELGNTLADVILEYATILCAHVYYDVNGRFVLEPMIDNAEDITDFNKEILWEYSVDEKTFLGLSQTYDFEKVYNDFKVLGNIVNGYQFKGRVQNINPASNTCIQRIGLKSNEPYEDNQYVSDEQCIELAKYYAKAHTILQKSGNIDSVVLYHLDVNKIVTISTPNNSMCKEMFLITGFSISESNKMSVNVTSINVLKDFSVVEV